MELRAAGGREVRGQPRPGAGHEVRGPRGLQQMGLTPRPRPQGRRGQDPGHPRRAVQQEAPGPQPVHAE